MYNKIKKSTTGRPRASRLEANNLETFSNGLVHYSITAFILNLQENIYKIIQKTYYMSAGDLSP
jgi:hypothetical protein